MHEASKVIYVLSVYCLILLSASNAFQNIVTKIHTDEGDSALGPFALMINFTTALIVNMFVSKFRDYSEKWLITIPALTMATFYLTGFLI